MKRFDLRHLGGDFYTKMGEILESSLQNGEVGILLFELGEFSNVAKSAEFAKKNGCEILNSVRFNHRDWTLVVRKGFNLASEAKSPSQAKSANEADLANKADLASQSKNNA